MKKNILFIVDHLKGGGSERMALELAEALSKTHNVSMALMNSDNINMTIPPQINMYHLNIHNKFMSSGLWRRNNKTLKQHEIDNLNTIVEHEKPDLIILSHWYAMHLLPFLKGNVWVWVHSDIYRPTKKKTSNLFRWYKETRNHYFSTKNFPKILNGKNIIVVNQDFSKKYSPYIPDANIKVIHNAVDFKKFKIENSDLNTKKWDCIFLGRLSKEKQADYAIRAFVESKLKGRMAIVGDGPLMQELINLAESLNVRDRIDFIGWVADVSEYIMQSHVLILSSKYEGFGLVISESLCLKTPVVAFNCSDGIYFQLNSGELKRGLVEPQNLSLLTETLKDIYDHPYVIQESDLEKLSIEKMVVEFEKLIPN